MPHRFFYRIIPLLVLWSIWAFNITLFFSSDYSTYSIHPYTWRIITVSILTLSIGYLLILFLYDEHHFSTLKEIDVPISIETIRRYLIILSVISLIGNILYLNEVASFAGSIGKFISDPIKARIIVIKSERFAVTNWNPLLAFSNYLANFNLVGVLLGGYYFIFGHKNKIIAFFPILNSILFSIFSFQRYAFVQITATWIFCIIYCLNIQEKHLRKAQAKRILYYVLGISLISFAFILGIKLILVDYGTGKVDMLDTSAWALKTLSTYLVGELIALDKYLLKTDIYLYGLSIFRGFIKWFVRLGLYDSSLGLSIYNEFISVGKTSVNTYTYIRPFYEDFGIYGLLIFNFLFGVLGSLSVHSLMKQFTFVKLYLGSLFFFGYFLSFFNFTLLNLTMFLFIFILVYGIEKMMIHRSKNLAVLNI